MRKRLLVIGALAVAAALLVLLAARRATEAPPPSIVTATAVPAAALEEEQVSEPVRWVPATDAATQEREGISFRFELLRDKRAELRAKELDVRLELKLSDARSGEPIRALHPLAWMWRREGDKAPDEAACREQVKTYLGGLLSAQAEVDFNAYLALTLNNDNTVSVINPQIAFSRTKLKGLIALPGAAGDWAINSVRSEAYATIPARDRLAVLDTARGKLRGSIRVGARPNRVAVAPDGSGVWVGADGDGAVSVLDPAATRVRKRIETAPGHQQLAFDPDRRKAWVAGSEGTRLTVIDLETLERSDGPEIGAGVVGLAWAPHASAVLALRRDAGELVLVDAVRREVVGRVQTGGKPHALAVEPTGRWAFLLEREEGRVVIVDTATQRIRQYVGELAEPDALAFTSRFAYVRQASDPRVALIALAGLGREEQLAPTKVAIAQHPPNAAFSPGLVSAIAPLPEDSGVLVAAPADKALYVYTQGMMAASGSHPNYGREPRAVMLVDRSLRETEPGLYVAHGEVPEPGLYDAAIMLDSPRVAVCVTQRIGGSETKKREPPLVVEALYEAQKAFLTGERASLRFRVRDPKRAEPLRADELTVMVQRPPTTFHAAPVPVLQPDGSFEVSFVPDDPGLYKLLLAAKSRGVEVGAVWPLDVKVTKPGAGKKEEKR